MSGILPLVVTNVRRNFARTVLTVAGMGLAALVMTASLTLSQGYPAMAFDQYRDYLGGDILLYSHRVFVRGGDVSAPSQWTHLRQAEDVPGPACFFQPGLRTSGFVQGAGQLGFVAEQVEAISSQLLAAGLVREVRPYLTVPVGLAEFRPAAGPAGAGPAPSVVWDDVYLRGWRAGGGWTDLGKYVVDGRPLEGTDEGRLVCLVDSTRQRLSQIEGFDFPAGLPPVGGTVSVMLPRISTSPSGEAAVNYLEPIWVELEVVGHYEVATRTASWTPEGSGGAGEPPQPEFEQLYLTSPEIIVPYETAEAVLREISGGAVAFWGHAIALEVDNFARVESSVDEIAAAFPQFCAVSVPRQAGAANDVWLPEPVFRVPPELWGGSRELAQVAQPVPVSRAFNVIFFAIASLLAAANGMVLVLERQREIGILKAVGAFRRDVIAMVLGEIVLLASIGAAAGFVAAEGMAVWNLLSNRTPFATVALTVGMDFIKVFGLTVMFALLFGLVPAMRTTSMTAMEVLRRE